LIEQGLGEGNLLFRFLKDELAMLSHGLTQKKKNLTNGFVNDIIVLTSQITWLAHLTHSKSNPQNPKAEALPDNHNQMTQVRIARDPAMRLRH